MALIGLIVAIAVLFTQATFSVVGWGGLGIMLLSLVAWIFMAPDQARAVITGRTVRFGGTSLIITVVFVLALIGIYTVVRAQSWQVDLTQRDEFSLSTEGRAAIAALGGDPTLPDMKITAFYDASMAQDRDRDELLFKDYAQTSGGNILTNSSIQTRTRRWPKPLKSHGPGRFTSRVSPIRRARRWIQIRANWSARSTRMT